MNDAWILGAYRSPIGRYGGGLAPLRADDMLGELFSALISKTQIDPECVGEVYAGCANQAGEDNRNVARMAWLSAGLPYQTPAITVNRLCASGLDAVITASRAIWCGDHDLVVASGVENMSRAPFVMPKSPKAYGGGNKTIFDSALGWRFPNPRLEARFPLEGMGETAENIAERYQIAREHQDSFALSSHEKALEAIEAGRFKDEIIAMEVPGRKSPVFVDKDEGPRADTTLDKLAGLKAVFRAGGSVTAGNSSTLNDGAAALLIGSKAKAKELGLTPMAKIVASASVGLDPQVMGLGPIYSTPKALDKAGIKIGDVDLIELNEAFAVQSLAVIRELGLDEEKLNVNGGAIALGHPLGCSGARILTTLVHQMQRQDAGYGLASLCVGVGQGVSLVVKR
jgi:acetyl-CoA acyltransferase